MEYFTAPRVLVDAVDEQQRGFFYAAAGTAPQLSGGEIAGRVDITWNPAFGVGK